MAISFNQIPADTLTPFTYVEFDSSNASRGLAGRQPYKILLLGQKLSGGEKKAGELLRISDDSQAAKFFGQASMLHHMARYLFRNNTQTEVFALAFDDPGEASPRQFRVSLRENPRAETEYAITLTRSDQSKSFSFTTGENATETALLNGLRTEALKVDVISAATVSSRTLVITVADGWNVSVPAMLSLESPDPKLGKARGEFKISGSATANGTLSVYVGDRAYHIAVQSGNESPVIAQRLKDAISGDDLAYVDAKSQDDAVQVFAKHRGKIGKDILLQFNYQPWDVFPEGLEESSIVQMTGGIGSPDLEKLDELLGDEQFNVIAFPYHDTQSLSIIDEVLEKRWGPENPIDGHAFTALDLDFNDLLSRSEQMNSKHITVMGAGGVPTPSFCFAAALAGVNAMHAAIDPARPQQTLEVRGVLPPKRPLRRNLRDQLLKNGVATFTTTSGKVFIERLVTTYKRNPLGARDMSYLDVAVKQTLSYLRWDFRNHFMTRYPRHKLATDDSRIAAGQAVITPKTAKAEAISRFSRWEKLGLVEDLEQFKKELVVLRSESDPNRLDFLLPPNLMNQLRVIGAQIAFIL